MPAVRSVPQPAGILSPGDLREVARVHAAVVLFYVVDAVLLSVHGLCGAVPGALGWQYGVVGSAIAVLQILHFRRGRHDKRALSCNTVAMSLSASLVMLATAALHPQVGGLMLMSVMTMIAASALQLRRGLLRAVYLACAGGAALVLTTTAAPLQWPTATFAQRATTAVWFAWLLAKCAAQNVAGTRLRQLARHANDELAAALAEVERAATTDELTTLPNRRSIMAGLDHALERTTQRVRAGAVAVALFDIDHFKSVNDRFGHAVGDEVLHRFGVLVAASLRPTDTVGRYGGEEFLLVLEGVRDAAAAAEATDRLRRVIEAHDWSSVAAGLAVTASAGVALVGEGEDAPAGIRRADAALYAAKAAGRNRVEPGTPADAAGVAVAAPAAARRIAGVTTAPGAPRCR